MRTNKLILTTKPAFLQRLENASIITKFLLLGLITLVAASCLLLIKPLPQPISYHNFADTRKIIGIPNGLNVLTNLPFIIIGIQGGWLLLRKKPAPSAAPVYGTLFFGIFFTGLGSAYYHLQPSNDTLVFDRLPMTIIFMSFLAMTVSECIHQKAGTLLLLPFVVFGLSSVLYWHVTELRGAGDLRWYGFVQFYPVYVIPLIALLFPSPVFRAGLPSVLWINITYAIAKICEYFDYPIYTMTHCISGHTLKHIAASFAAWFIVQMFQQKFPE